MEGLAEDACFTCFSALRKSAFHRQTLPDLKTTHPRRDDWLARLVKNL
jgi:hypothetical protein